ncbi:MAG: D-glycero-beta-D-manno-heptose-7-phosphate kinase [Saprospirales bacterium]|nr:MAG: D-glycero-beta-D-manno-heptose-7-phosphate kinase [Saprospirales bacterium]
MFEKPKVLVIGDLMLDTYITGTSDRLSPEAPVPVVDQKDSFELPGGAANVAINFKGLDAEVSLCGYVGSDESGHKLIDLLETGKVQNNGVLISKYRRTTEKVRIISNERQILRIDREDRFYLNDDEERKLLAKINEHVADKNPEIIVLQDYNKGVLTTRIIKEVMNIGKQIGAYVAVDPKKHHFFDYKGADLFKPNLTEYLIANSLDKYFPIERIAKRISDDLREIGCKNLMVTMSEHGILAANRNEILISEANNDKVKDVSGAGDTVLAVATLALFSGFNLSDTAWICNRAAAIVCKKSGVCPIALEELNEVCKRHFHDQ